LKIKNYNIPFLLLLLSVALLVACGGKTAPQAAQPQAPVVVPTFDADSAYHYTAGQVAFGPRVPNTEAHRQCGDWLESQLRRFGAQVTAQHVTLRAYDGTVLAARNIIGSYKPDTRKRVLLCAHWDSRPWADADPDPKHHRTPILGANDGASGVGVLLEVARQLQAQPTDIGIDIIFFDAEDYGEHADHDEPTDGIAWCLGSQYWARVPHVDGYMARFGILLDMVGGRDVRFHREGLSDYFARPIVDKVWAAAHASGHGQWFPYAEGGVITDDHLPINQIARIPCIDIIGHYPETGFAPTWHTMDDTMDNIDPAVLRAVGQTVLQVIYNEK
jgi:hypothetical protein